MRLLLRVHYIKFNEQKRGEWLENESYLKTVLGSLKESGLLDRCEYFGEYSKLKKLTSFDSIVEKSSGWKVGKNYQFDLDGSVTKYYLGLNIRPLAMGLIFSLDLDYIDYDNRYLEKLVNLVLDLKGKLKDSASLEPNVGIEILDFEYPRVKPPRNMPGFGQGRVVDIVNSKSSPDNFNLLSNAALPEGCSREISDGLLILKWAEDLSDREALAQALSDRELFLYETLDFDLDSSYNEFGDYRELSLHELTGAEDSSGFLTFYDSISKVGFKSVVTTEDGDLDGDIKQEMARLLSQGSLDDGRKLKGVRLITSSRRSALLLYLRAVELNIDKAFYVDNQGTLWNPLPDGLWRE